MSYLVGEDRAFVSPTQPAGVKADELNYSPWVSPGYVSAAWVMLTNTYTQYYAQVGWLEYASGDRHLFMETGPGDGIHFHRTLFSPQPINSVSTVEVSWKPGVSYDFYLNGVLLYSDSYVYAKFSPTHAQIAGEIHNIATQMPGGYTGSLYQSWKNERVWYPATPGGNWHYFNENFNSAVDFNNSVQYFGSYNYPNPNLDSQYIYDKSCPH